MIISQNQNNKISGVYEIVNIVNGHKYVGSSINIKYRWTEHKKQLRNGLHHSRYLQRAWDKYGESSFVFNVIEYCEREELILREQYYINNILPSYNLSPTAGSSLGVKHSVETCRKISERTKGIPSPMLGKHHSIETRNKLSEANKGKIVSEETRLKISVANSGNGHSQTEETRSKISNTMRGRVPSWRIGKEPWNKNNHISGMTGKKHSEETKLRMSQSSIGKKHSEEDKNKMSEIRRKWWENKKRANS